MGSARSSEDHPLLRLYIVQHIVYSILDIISKYGIPSRLKLFKC